MRLERLRKKVSIMDIGSEAANRGDMKNLLSNITKKNKGKRYTKFTKSMYEVTMIWGGTRLVNFLAANLDGPDAHSVRRMLK